MNVSVDSVLLSILSNSKESTFTSKVSTAFYENLFSYSRSKRVSQMVYHRILRKGIKVPDEVLEKFKKEYFLVLHRNIKLLHTLDKILKRFNEKNIQILPLKGSYLTNCVYKNIGLRNMADIDLLIKRKDFLQLDSIMKSLGYSPKKNQIPLSRLNHHRIFIAENLPIIEMHRDLVKEYICNIHTDEIWRRTEQSVINNIPICVMQPEDLIVYLCVHISEHVNSLDLQMLIDVQQVIEVFKKDINWLKILERSSKWGITRSVFVILSIIEELQLALIPGEFLNKLQPDDFDRKYLLFMKDLFLRDTLSHKQVKTPVNVFGVLLEGFNLTRQRISDMYQIPIHSWRILMYIPVFWKTSLSIHLKSIQYDFWTNKKKQRNVHERFQSYTLRKWLLQGSESATINESRKN